MTLRWFSCFSVTVPPFLSSAPARSPFINVIHISFSLELLYNPLFITFLSGNLRIVWNQMLWYCCGVWVIDFVQKWNCISFLFFAIKSDLFIVFNWNYIWRNSSHIFVMCKRKTQIWWVITKLEPNYFVALFLGRTVFT